MRNNIQNSCEIHYTKDCVFVLFDNIIIGQYKFDLEYIDLIQSLLQDHKINYVTILPTGISWLNLYVSLIDLGYSVKVKYCKRENDITASNYKYLDESDIENLKLILHEKNNNYTKLNTVLCHAFRLMCSIGIRIYPVISYKQSLRIIPIIRNLSSGFLNTKLLLELNLVLHEASYNSSGKYSYIYVDDFTSFQFTLLLHELNFYIGQLEIIDKYADQQMDKYLINNQKYIHSLKYCN